jgi:hypothetical protein
MPALSAKIASIILTSSAKRNGIVSAQAQALAKAVVVADGKIDSHEIATMNRVIAKAGQGRITFEGGRSFRNQMDKLTGASGRARSFKPIGQGCSASVRIKRSLQWQDNRLVFTGADAFKLSRFEDLFQVPQSKQSVKEDQSVFIPLQNKNIHMIEMEYSDDRPLGDLEFSYRKKGLTNWKKFRGKDLGQMMADEKSGNIELKREPDHNSLWINNPVKVKIEIAYPNGSVGHVGDKFLDYHVHDADEWDPTSTGYPETDNINPDYEDIPTRAIPEGSFLKVTPYFANRKPWEKRKKAADIMWVKPIYVPVFKSSRRVYDAVKFNPPKSEGYKVDPSRKIAAVKVTWTDWGKPFEGKVTFDGFSSDYSNIGSGETELINCDNQKAANGRLFIKGSGKIGIQSVEVLYAD